MPIMQSARSRRLACHILGSSAIGVGFCMMPVAHASDLRRVGADLASADTVIAVEAGEQAPRLTTLGLRGAMVWKNRTGEALPDHIEVRGTGQSLVWRLDRASSRFDSKQIELVYASESPRLNLVWRWCVRAGHGPIEHTVLIQNLSNETVWLPLQPSFRFDWMIDPRASLERLWVEKGADSPSAQGTHLDALHDGDTWQGTSSTYARPIANQAREMIPYLLVDEPDGARAPAELDADIPAAPSTIRLIDQEIGNHLARLVDEGASVGAGRALPGITVVQRVEVRALSGGRVGALFHPQALQRGLRIDHPVKTKAGLQRQPCRFVAQVLDQDGVFDRAISGTRTPAPHQVEPWRFGGVHQLNLL